jgi:hypothetical protein
VIAFQTSARGASNSRVMTITGSFGELTSIVDVTEISFVDLQKVAAARSAETQSPS